MIKYFSKTFKITNENIILTTPLVLFLFLLSIYLEVAKNAPQNFIASILLITTILFMLSAFFAGWLYMVKQAIELDKKDFVIDDERAKASFNLLKDLPIGIGEYFLPFIGTLILYTVLMVGLFIMSYKLGLYFIGKVGLTFAQLKIAMGSAAAMKSLITTLSAKELIKINYWYLLFLASASFFSFITMFWAPEIIFKTPNPILALGRAIVFTFKHFLSAIILFVYVSLVNFMVSTVNAISTINPILYFVSMLVYFYFVVYIVVLVFLYYGQENQPKSQAKNISEQNNSNCGADSNGQEPPCDSNSEGN